MTAETARKLTPTSDIDKVRLRLSHTTDAKTLIGLKGLPTFGRVTDIRPSVERAEKDAILSLRELLDCAAVLRTARSLTDYVKSDRTPDTSLMEIFERREDEGIEIELIGLCTDICVVSNALYLKATLPETPISCDASCCAGVTPAKHEAALETMRSCQIKITNA